MANGNCDRTPPAGPLSRPEYREGSYLTAAECSLEQNYRLQSMRRHNRRLHGWGVVCGLWVVPGDDPSHPWQVQVCPGYAIGPYGDEIEVRDRTSIDLRDFLWSRPRLFERNVARFIYVVVRYEDRPNLLRPVPTDSCECEEPAYSDSRLGDSFEIAAVWTPPSLAAPQTLCSGDSVPCPDCPQLPWLTLARIFLPVATSAPITAARIDNGIRTTL
jgi:hypothetical protein